MEESKNPWKKCAPRKCRSWVCLQMTQLQCPMGCHGDHAILCNPNSLRFIFGENKNFWYWVVPLNNFTPMSYCPWVQDKSNKPPPEVCVCVGGCQIVIPWSYLHFIYINIHDYENEKILYVTIVWKDLLNCITDDIITCNKDSLGQNSVYICFFLWFSLIFWNFHQYWWICKLDN